MNNVARQLLQPQDDNQVHFLTSATMAIINEVNSAQAVVKIENLQVIIVYKFSFNFIIKIYFISPIIFRVKIQKNVFML